jgi:metal-sulfur cluster biosynthetic enzyme
VARIESSTLERSIEQSLRQVIDPETDVDVVRMRLVEGLQVDEGGFVRYTFRPSSPFCPIAVYLAVQIKKAVAEVPGVSGQRITIEGYIAAYELTELLNQEA